MNFIKKHPYLFWQMIGSIFVGALVLHMLFALDSGWNNSFIVIMLMGACLITLGSPLVIRLVQKNAEHPDTSLIERAVFEYHVSTNGHAFEAVMALMLFAIPLAGTLFLCYVGLPFLFPLTLYLDVVVYQVWKMVIMNSFYTFKDGEKRCRVIEADDDMIEKLCVDNAVSYIHDPDDDFLRFLYNMVRGQKELSDETLDIYCVSAESINRLYGTDLNIESKPMLCIPTDVLHTEEVLPIFRSSYVCLKALTDDEYNFLPKYIYDKCPFCADSFVYFYIENDTGELFLRCEDCGESFDINSSMSVSSRTRGESRPADYTEIKAAGYEENIRKPDYN